MRELTVKERAQLGSVVAWRARRDGEFVSSMCTWRAETIAVYAPDATIEDAERIGLGRGYREMRLLRCERGDPVRETGVTFTVFVSG